MPPTEYLYHVTYLKDLEGITSDGLQPGRGQTFARAYEGHASGRVFLTSWDGVSFWAQRYGELSIGHTDTPEDGWVPVVLRVDVDLIEGELSTDEPGSTDARAPSYFTGEAIDADLLDVWDGGAWVELESAELSAMNERMMDAAEYEESDEDDGEGWYYMDNDVLVPDEEDEEG